MPHPPWEVMPPLPWAAHCNLNILSMEKFSLMSSLSLSRCRLRLCPLVSCSVTTCLGEGTDSHLATTSFWVVVESDKISPESPFFFFPGWTSPASLPRYLKFWRNKNKFPIFLISVFQTRRMMFKQSMYQSLLAKFY